MPNSEKGTLPTCSHSSVDKDCAACVWGLHQRAQRRDHENIVAILTEALRYVEAGDGHGPVVLRDALARLDKPYGMVYSRSLDSLQGSNNGLRSALREACGDAWPDGEAVAQKYARKHGVLWMDSPANTRSTD